MRQCAAERHRNEKQPDSRVLEFDRRRVVEKVAQKQNRADCNRRRLGYERAQNRADAHYGNPPRADGFAAQRRKQTHELRRNVNHGARRRHAHDDHHENRLGIFVLRVREVVEVVGQRMPAALVIENRKQRNKPERENYFDLSQERENALCNVHARIAQLEAFLLFFNGIGEFQKHLVAESVDYRARENYSGVQIHVRHFHAAYERPPKPVALGIRVLRKRELRRAGVGRRQKQPRKDQCGAKNTSIYFRVHLKFKKPNNAPRCGLAAAEQKFRPMLSAN